MSKLRIYGDTSGYVDFNVPAIAGTTTININRLLETDANGRVMIGTTTEGYSPNADLFTIANTATTSSDAGMTIRAGTAGESSIYFSDATSGAGEYQSSIWHNHSTNEFNIRTADTMLIYAGNSERMRIDSSGNVGIGINSPTAGFRTSIKGDYSSVVGGIEFDSGGGDKFTVGHASATSPSAKLNVVGAGHLIMATDNTERVRIAHTTGYVGIGSDSPTFNLSVQRVDNETYSTTGFPNGTGHFFKKNNSGIANQYSSIRLQVTNDNGSSNAQACITAIKTSASTHATTLAFQTRQAGGSVAEAFRIDHNQTMLFGCTSASGQYNGSGANGISFNNAGANGQYVAMQNSSDANIYLTKISGFSDSRVLNFGVAGSSVGTVTVTSSATTYNTTSDKRLKENIMPIQDATEKILAMNPISHTWINDKTAPAQHGFIAQEMQSIVPEAVSGDPDSEEMMQMDYGKITPVIVKSLQNALNEISSLKKRISELEKN